MNNLFKKGFASLALASVMTSSIFAGNAAYIDVKVNYLGGKGVAVLGYDDMTTANDNRDKVELLVSILDKDGDYATKTKDGKASINPVALSGNLPDAVQTATGIITRSIDAGKNVQRFVLDYTMASSSKLENEITFTTGIGSSKLERKITLKLGSVDAAGLIVRATPNGEISTETYINAMFSDINVTGSAAELNASSSKAPGGLVGMEIPIQVYASTMDYNESANGRFTFAPNLEGKTIIVQALADYNEDGYPRTILNSIELKMENGQASGMIKITAGLTAGLDGIAVNPLNDALFEPVLNKGLGIAFLVYAKDKQSINNYADTITDSDVMADEMFDMNMSLWVTPTGTSTDTIQMKSGEPASLKIGMFDRDARTMSKLWTGTSSTVFISDSSDTNFTNDGYTADINTSHTATSTLTVIDSYGNPTIVTDASAVGIKFGSDKTSKIIKVTEGNIVTTAALRTSVVNVVVSDSKDTNNTTTIKSVAVTIDASNGMLASIDPVMLTVKTLPLIEVTKDGGIGWKNSIKDIRTTADFTAVASFPTVSLADVVKVTQNDFTVVIKSGLGDSNLSDRNSTFRVYIKDNSGDSEFLEGGDLTKYDIKIAPVPTGVAGPTFGIVGLFSGYTTATNNAGRTDKATDGYIRFDYNSSNSSTQTATDSDFNITISDKSKNVILATIIVAGYNGGNNEEEIVINIPTFEDKKISAFVEVYVDKDVDLDEATPGTIVNFKFTGKAVSEGDKIVIDMNSSGLAGTNGNTNTEGRIGLVGSKISDNTDGMITTTLPKNGIVSVVLYDTNKDNNGIYGFSVPNYKENNRTAVKINGIVPVWLYTKENGDTDDIKELNTSDSIKMARLDDQSISKVRLRLTTNGSGDGSADDKRKALPETVSMTNKAITADKSTVLTGLYYDIFSAITDIVLLDMYSNAVEGLKDDFSKDVSFSATSGIEIDNDGADSWIKFKESAAGTKQTLTITFTKDDGSKVSNTITWTKIKLSKTNSGFMITDNFGGFRDPNTGVFDVVNSEIVVKIMGNGNQKQSSTKIKLSHTDKDAKLRLVKVSDLASNLYDNALSGLDDSITTTIGSDGSYYIVSSDKAGTLTIAVSSKVKDAKDNDVAISGTHKITFDAIDLNAPMVVENGVVAANGQITVEVTDDNLNTVATTVMVTDINGKNPKKAVYTNGKYVLRLTSTGMYQVEINGVDMAGNMQRFNFTRTLGEASATLEDALVSNGSYVINGTFASHDFKGVDSAFDWVYTTGKEMYQLNGKDSKDTSPFKWSKVTDITADNKNAWSMVQLTGSAGSADEAGAYGWVLVNAKGDTFKLAGANSDGTFKFSKALYVRGTISGSNVSFAKR